MKRGIFLLIFVLLATSGLSVELYTSDDPPATPAPGDLPLQASITKDGITWTFSEQVRVGEFVNGDYYVVGPVTITAITPSPSSGRHGSALNHINPQTSPFDDRVSSNRFSANARANLPISMQPGDSLVSSISLDVAGSLPRVLRTSDNSPSPIRTMSVLTCLSEPAPPDAFRPSYAGSQDSLYLSRYLKRDILPNLDPVPSTPLFSEFEEYLRRPWYDVLQFGFDAPAEYMPNYGREVARVSEITSLLLLLDVPALEKEALLVYYTQYGIDLYGLVEAGHMGWPGWGGSWQWTKTCNCLCRHDA